MNLTLYSTADTNLFGQTTCRAIVNFRAAKFSIRKPVSVAEWIDSAVCRIQISGSNPQEAADRGHILPFTIHCMDFRI